MKKYILFAGCLLMGVQALSAKQINVNASSLNNNARGAIQAAIDGAQPGDLIHLPAGTYNVQGVIEFKEGLWIQGSGIGSTILVKSESNNNQILRLRAMTGEAFRISDITFRGKGFNLLKSNPNSLVIDKGVSVYGKASGCVIRLRY